MESLRLLHVDLLVQITICECRGDVHGTKFKVFYSSYGHNNAKCGRTEGGCKAFVVVKSRVLRALVERDIYNQQMIRVK